MNDESQLIPLSRLKRAVWKAADRAKVDPKQSLLDMRQIIDDIIRPLYKRHQESLKNYPDNTSIGKLIRALLEAGHLPGHLTKPLFDANEEGNAGAHRLGPLAPTRSNVVNCAKNTLFVLRWFDAQDGQQAKQPLVPLAPVDRSDSTAITVFLAYPGSDVEEEWGELRRTLEEEGANVVPVVAPDRSSDTGMDIIRNNAQRADIFVQVFSPVDSFDLPKWQLEMVRAQSKLRRTEIPFMRWRKKFPSEDDFDAEILDSLGDGEDRAFCEVEREIKFSMFKATVIGKFKELTHTPSRDPVDKPKPYLCIRANRVNMKDEYYARQLMDELGKCATVDLYGSQKDFEKALAAASAVVFLYGDTQCDDIEKWAQSYNRAKVMLQLKQKLRVKIAALYNAPPDQVHRRDECPAIDRAILRLGSRVEFDLNDVPRICAKLHQ